MFDYKNAEKILEAEDVVVKFNLRGKTLTAIRGISMELYKGESLAIVGESGSGKSVFTKTFMGLLDQNGWVDSGSIIYSGGKYAGKGVDLVPMKTEKEWLNIRGKEIAMVFQDPMTSLNPLKTIGKQIQETVELHQNLKGEEAKKKTIEILEDVGIAEPERRYKQYPHEFSGGMRQRVVIAIAVACNPEILICDEPTTALDVTIQAQILKLLHNLQEKYQLTIIYITHDLGVVAMWQTGSRSCTPEISWRWGSARRSSTTPSIRTAGRFSPPFPSWVSRASPCIPSRGPRPTCSMRSRATLSLREIPRP